MRALPIALGLFIAVVLLVGAGYLLGSAHGRRLERRWAKIVQPVLRWRQAELQSSTNVSDVLLDSVRDVADAELARRDKAYLELEEGR